MFNSVMGKFFCGSKMHGNFHPYYGGMKIAANNVGIVRTETVFLSFIKIENAFRFTQKNEKIQLDRNEIVLNDEQTAARWQFIVRGSTEKYTLPYLLHTKIMTIFALSSKLCLSAS